MNFEHTERQSIEPLWLHPAADNAQVQRFERSMGGGELLLLACGDDMAQTWKRHSCGWKLTIASSSASMRTGSLWLYPAAVIRMPVVVLFTL